MLERRASSPVQYSYSSIQSFLLYVFFHTFRNKFLDGPLGANCIADFSRRDFLIHVVQQVQSHAAKHQISLGRLPGKRFGHLRSRSQLFRKSVRNFGQRVSRTARNHESAFGKKLLRGMPFGDVFKRIDPNQEEQSVDFFKPLLQLTNRINTVIRSRRDVPLRTLFVVQKKFSRSLKQRGYQTLPCLSSQRNHGVPVEIRSNRLRRFVRRRVSGNKINADQIESFPRRHRERKMPLMNGIKCTAKKADIHSLFRPDWYQLFLSAPHV